MAFQHLTTFQTLVLHVPTTRTKLFLDLAFGLKHAQVANESILRLKFVTTTNNFIFQALLNFCMNDFHTNIFPEFFKGFSISIKSQ